MKTTKFQTVSEKATQRDALVLSEQFVNRSNARAMSITSMNIAYLNLAKTLIQEDVDSARAYLGISEETCELIESLTPAQTAALCNSGKLLCALNLSDGVIKHTLAGKEEFADPVHLAIMMLQQA